MELDAFDLFGRCHRIYVQAMRRVIRNRLEEHYGKDWWTNGVLAAFWDDWPKQLDEEAKRRGLPDYQEILDTRHFGYILTRQNHTLFQREFPDTARAFKRFQEINAVRNGWAHVQDVSTGHLYQASNTIKDILAALNLREALEVERLRGMAMNDRANRIEEEPIEGIVLEGESIVANSPLTEPIDSWKRLSSYLRIEQEITYQDIPEGRIARVTVTLRNIAPASENDPQVIFRDVILRDMGARRSNTREAALATWGIGDLEPGESKEAEIEIPWQKLAEFDLHTSGRIDGAALLNFRNSIDLAREAATDLRQRFAELFKEINIEGLVTEVMETLSAIDETASMIQIREARGTIKDFSSRASTAVRDFNRLGSNYGLRQESPILARLTELQDALKGFEAIMQRIDEALGESDPEKLREIQASLQDAQLAVLRVESELRSVGGS